MGYTLDQGMSENDIKTTLISEEEKFVRSVPAPAAPLRCLHATGGWLLRRSAALPAPAAPAADRWLRCRRSSTCAASS